MSDLNSSIDPQQTGFYFVDEAGDPNLFNRRKQIVVGQDGCSTFFILGMLEVGQPDLLSQQLEALRQTLLQDPYFQKVPSFQTERQKTAISFHAKDDLPEVRREVFRLLIQHEVKFFAVVRDKRRIVRLVREHNLKQPTYRYHPNQLYDRCVSRLFKERLHKNDAYRIVFARRGASDRTAALRNAIGTARSNFRQKWRQTSQAPIEVVPALAKQEPCLQAADYFLWALQRLFERGEDRYWNFVWPKVGLVYDIDDTRTRDYGEFYSQRNPLDLSSVQQRTPGI